MKLEKFITDLLDHIDEHKAAYNKWDNPQIAKVWLSTWKHIVPNIDLGTSLPITDEFKKRRRLLNMSMQDVTNETEISKATISRLEKGHDAFFKTVMTLDKFYKNKQP